MYIPHESFGVNLVRGTRDGELHAQRVYDLCRAVDMTKLSIVLADMVKTGHISPRQQEAFDCLARGLLNTMLTENARSFIGSASQSTAETVVVYGVATNGQEQAKGE